VPLKLSSAEALLSHSSHLPKFLCIKAFLSRNPLSKTPLLPASSPYLHHHQIPPQYTSSPPLWPLNRATGGSIGDLFVKGGGTTLSHCSAPVVMHCPHLTQPGTVEPRRTLARAARTRTPYGMTKLNALDGDRRVGLGHLERWVYDMGRFYGVYSACLMYHLPWLFGLYCCLRLKTHVGIDWDHVILSLIHCQTSNAAQFAKQL